MRVHSFLAMLALALLAACGAAGAAGLSARDPWVRAAAGPTTDHGAGHPAGTSAAYLTLRNQGGEPDALVSVATDVAEAAELHSTTNDGGIMRMRPVAELAIPARGELALEPGGHHIMLIGLRQELAPRQTVRLTLTMASGATLELAAEVRAP